MSAAGTYCKDRFATLIPVTDVDVAAMVKEYYPDTSLYWTAGYYENSSAINGWVWMDQGYNSIQDVAQLNFDMNVYHKSLLESTTASSGMCVALMNGNPLRIRNCTLAFKLICSRKHHSRICPPGYGASGSRCLSLGQYNHTHTEAESICANRFGQLFEPRTLMDLQDIYNLATEYNWNKYDLRVGITYKNNAWRFASDGAQIPADLWSSNYPLMQVNKTCALYNATTKKLVNAGCNDLQYYICIYNSKPHCPAGFLSFGWSSECYMIAPFKLPYPSSASYCKMWGGEIATIRENYTKTQVNDLQYNRMDAVSNIYLWVDLQDTTYDGMYQFSDGTMMRGVTLSSTGGNCFYLYTSNIYATSCSNSASIQPLCMAKKGDCPMGFLNRGNSCYRFSNEQRYYDVSAIYCGYYSSLLSWTFNSSVLVNGLSTKGYQPVKSTGTPYWMGGQFNTTIGMWILSNNANVTYPSSGSLLGGLWEANNPVVGDVCMVLNSQGRLESKTCGTNNTNRFICETTKNQIGMNLPRHDFPILQPTCFMENQYDPQFRISPGNYDPEKLSLTLCKGRCLALGFNYAGATYGKYCFCSNILTLEAVSSNICNKSCSSSASSEICGSVDGKYITVIRVGSSATSGQAFISGATLSSSPLQVNVEGTVTFNTSLKVGEGSFYRLRFGEGIGFTLGTKLNFTTGLLATGIPATKSYKYYHPGVYVATVMYYDEEGIKSPAYESVTVNVTSSPPSPVKIDCPVVVEPREPFYCRVTLFRGNSLVLSFTRGDGSISDNYSLPEPRIQHMGFPAPQEVMVDMIGTAMNSTAAVIMPWTRLNENSVLLAFSAYVSTPGIITFMILRPVCNGNPVCPTTGKCDSSCAGLNGTSYTCSSGSFCVHGLSCFDQSSALGSCKYSVGPMPDNYQVIVEEKVTTTAGFNYIKIDQTIRFWPPLQQGDVVGFIPGSAVVAYYLTSKESDMGFSAPGSYLSSNGKNLGIRHYVSATVSRPVTLDLPHNYSAIGNYTFTVQIQNSLGIMRNSSIIACQVPINLAPPGIPIFDPAHVTISNYTKVTIPVANGSDIFVMIDWGDNNITWKYFANLTDYNITDVHQYSQVGVYNTVIKIFNKHTIQDQMPLEQWTFWHVLLCQIGCNDSVWTFVNTGPVLWPTPGKMDFRISAPAGVELPTNSSFSINFGDGFHSGGLYDPDGTKMICGGPGVNGTPFCSKGFSYTETKAYETGYFNATFSCKNNASRFVMTSQVAVYASIQGVSATPMYLPFLPVGGTKLYEGYGPAHDQFPVERNVSFVMMLKQGTVLSYYAQLLNGTVISNSTTDTLDLKFDKPGRYTVKIYAVNPLQVSDPITVTIEVAESVSEVYIDDYNLVSDANTNKTFKIGWESKGSFSCFIVDYYDNTPVDVWRTLPEEYDECQQWLDKNAATLKISATMNKKGLIPVGDPFYFETEHLYVEKGFYIMSVYAFNKMSSSNRTLNVTVAPVPCTPPLLYLKENSTKFFDPVRIQRSFTIRVESVCKLNCTNTLNTSKFWTGVSINEEWGYPMVPVNMDGWDCRNKSILSIPPRTLDYGTYMFTYSVVIEDEWLKTYEPDIPPFRREKSTYIKVTKSPLVVLMNSGGLAKLVLGYNKIFLINPAEFSYDPDWPNLKDFDFKWYCHRISPTTEILPRDNTEGAWPTDGEVSKPLTSVEEITTYVFNSTTNTTEAIEEPDNGGCFGKGPGRILVEGGTLELNTVQLRKAIATYRIVVVMAKDTRKAEGSIDVELVPGSPPMVDVKCQIAKMCRFTSDGMFINPSSRLALMGSCNEDCYGSLGYSWSIYTYVNETETLVPDGINFMVNPDQANMVINNELFTAYNDVLEFHVKLTIMRLVDKEKGEGLMYLLINTPPGRGQCTLSPPKGRLLVENTSDIDPATGKPRQLGRALTEDFYCACLNFVDDQNDKITKYTFFLKHTVFGYIKNLKFGVDNKDRFAFPYGNWSMWVTISDEYGAASTIFIANFTTSLPTQSEYEAWGSKMEILRASGEGDQARLSQLLLASTSISNFKLENDVVPSTTTTPSSKGYLAPATTTMDPLIQKELEEKAQKELEQKQMVEASQKQSMISQLQSNNVDTLDDCAQLLSTMASIIGNGDLVDIKGKDAAVKVISGTCTASVLLNTTINDPKDAESLVSNNMQAISSLVTGTSDKIIEDLILPSDMKNTKNGDYGDVNAPADSELKERALKVQEEKARAHVQNMLDTVKLMQKKLLSIVFPGEAPVTVNTEDGLSMTLVMMKATDLFGYELWQGGGLYKFPDICDILKEEKISPGNCSSTESGNFTVGIQAVAWPTILQSFGKGAKDKLDRTTKTMQLSLLERISAVDVRMIPVEDLEPGSEIIIYIPRGSRKKSQTQLLDPMLVNPDEILSQSIPEDGPLVCTSLNISQPYSSVNIELVLETSEAKISVFIRKYFKATLVFYDMVIDPKTEAQVTNVSQPLLDVMDPLTNLTVSRVYHQYAMFLNDSFIGNDTGVYFICVGEFANGTDDEIFWEEPDMYNLTESNMTRHWTTNFTIRAYTSSCLFYNAETDSWDHDGCTVQYANYSHTICYCDHLTSFGSGFFPQPNKIDFNKLLKMNAADNPTIIITMIATVCIYIMVLIWGRFKDKEDLTKLGATPLPDNDPRDKYLYEIMVFTGGNEEAATKSKVQFSISGDQAESHTRTFEDPSRQIFKRNAIDIFVMAVPKTLGNLQYLRVWHDNSGKGKMASWYLRYMIIRDVQTGMKYEFICNKWFAVEHDDSKIDRLIAIAGDVQKKEFKHLFNTTSHKNLYDGHLWFSVFVRPARSRFTRVQRITACMALLYLSMVTNAMFFGVIPEEPGAGGLTVGPFSVSPAAIGVGIISNLITFPPTLIIIQLFRKASPKYKRVSRIQKAMNRQKEEKRREAESRKLLKQTAPLDASQVAEDVESPQRGQSVKLTDPVVKKKKQKSLPWWTLYIAWLVAVLSIAAGGFFTFSYGVQFGEEKTKKWLGALFVSFFSSVLFTQPIKVILMAIIFSAVFKKPVDDEDDADFDEREPILGEDEEWMHELGPGTREKKKTFQPVDEKFIKTAKVEREKEIKMWDVIYDIGAYAIFIWIVLVLSYGNRDPNSFLMKKELENNFILASLDPDDSNFYSVQNKSLFYHWLKTVFIGEIIMQENYNNKFNEKNDDRILLNDRVSLLLGYSTLRQIRLKEKPCRLPKIIKQYVTKECRSKTTLVDEEDEHFDIGWKPLAKGVAAREEYTFKGSLELDGMPFWGNIDVYSGAGYQVKLIGVQDAIIQKLNELEANNWIDERTRAVFVEFAIYNAQVNLFAALVICIEQGPEGALHPFVKINPIKLLRYSEGFGLFVMICEGLFIVFIVYYTYRELKEMCKAKIKYWKDSWNYLEVIVIILGWSAVVFYGIRTALGVYLMNRFKTNKTGYIKLDYAAHIDEVFLYIVSFLVFFATLKFIKLLRFNKRIGMLASTLKQCAADLSGFMMAFLLAFLSAAQMFFLLHYANSLNFNTFMSALESTFSAMLGQFDYDDIARSSPGLGPVSFFVFAFFMGIIMVNLLLTLILRSFYEIKKDIKKQGNEYEILDFILKKVRRAAGIGPIPSNIGPLNATTEDEKQEDDKTDEFPEKVDQLLNYINQFYFDSKLDLNNKEWLKSVSQHRDHSGLGINSGKPRTAQGWHGRIESDQPRSALKNASKDGSQKPKLISDLMDV